VSKTDPGLKGKRKTKYYLQATKRHVRDLHDIAEEISSRCTASTMDVVLILEALSQVVPQQLLDGYTVDLGDLGIFSAHLSSEGKEDPEKVTARCLKNVNVHFRPSPRFKSKMKWAEVTKETKPRSRKSPSAVMRVHSNLSDEG
ncbi:MAG: HU family DNA-binding protein, partial [Bacteroidota bacterium]